MTDVKVINSAKVILDNDDSTDDPLSDIQSMEERMKSELIALNSIIIERETTWDETDKAKRYSPSPLSSLTFGTDKSPGDSNAALDLLLKPFPGGQTKGVSSASRRSCRRGDESGLPSSGCSSSTNSPLLLLRGSLGSRCYSPLVDSSLSGKSHGGSAETPVTFQPCSWLVESPNLSSLKIDGGESPEPEDGKPSRDEVAAPTSVDEPEAPAAPDEDDDDDEDFLKFPSFHDSRSSVEKGSTSDVPPTTLPDASDPLLTYYVTNFPHMFAPLTCCLPSTYPAGSVPCPPTLSQLQEPIVINVPQICDSQLPMTNYSIPFSGASEYQPLPIDAAPYHPSEQQYPSLYTTTMPPQVMPPVAPEVHHMTSLGPVQTLPPPPMATYSSVAVTSLANASHHQPLETVHAGILPPGPHHLTLPPINAPLLPAPLPRKEMEPEQILPQAVQIQTHHGQGMPPLPPAAPAAVPAPFIVPVSYPQHVAHQPIVTPAPMQPHPPQQPVAPPVSVIQTGAQIILPQVLAPQPVMPLPQLPNSTPLIPIFKPLPMIAVDVGGLQCPQVPLPVENPTIPSLLTAPPMTARPLMEIKEEEKNNPKKTVRAGCVFCRSNGEREREYMGHRLKNPVTNVVECPQLRKFVCPICGATGDSAHTVSYCPSNHKLTGSTVKHLKAMRSSAGKKSGRNVAKCAELINYFT